MDPPVLISSLPPTRRQMTVACGLAVLFLVAFLAVLPYAANPTTGTEALLPAYAAASLIFSLSKSFLLVTIFNIQGSRAILLLAMGYLLDAALIVPWLLSFPGVFGSTGLFADLQGTAWIAATRRIGFPLFLLGYILLRDRCEQALRPHEASPRIAGRAALGTLAVAALLTWLFFTDPSSLPAFMADTRRTTHLWGIVPPIALGTIAFAVLLLWRSRKSQLDIWLMLTLFTAVIEIVLLAYASPERLSVGWWSGRVFGLASASIVFIAILVGTTSLYTRLARSVLAEQTMRESHLTTLETLSASIAHEINQPLASMVTNADAALRWLDRDPPVLDEARMALRGITRDGHRSSQIIDCVRASYRREAGPHEAVDINAQVIEALKPFHHVTAMARITVTRDLDPSLPPALGNATQIRQLLTNLLANAVDAMVDGNDGPRVLTIRTRMDTATMIRISVADSGKGLAPEAALPEPFFQPVRTTKPGGMGLGLMLCRMIVHSHGGRLWALANQPKGTIFHITIPIKPPSHQP